MTAKNVMHLRSRPQHDIYRARRYLMLLARAEPWQLRRCTYRWDNKQKEYMVFSQDGSLLAIAPFSKLPIVRRVAKTYGGTRWVLGPPIATDAHRPGGVESCADLM